jgi:outer membrane protein assembly factor BamE (lipoprotein component of BamABCDE complex)
MKTTRIFAVAAAALCAALISGCSTPNTRISRSPEAFARLNPDQQALVRAGQIAPGFDMEAVTLALGKPDYKTIVTNATGQHQAWHYVDPQGYIYVGYYHRFRGWGGPYFYGGMPYYGAYPGAGMDRIRVIFDTSGRVVSVEQEKA